MEKSPTPVPRITKSGCLALLAGLLIAALGVAGLGPEPELHFMYCANAVLPGLCIFTLARRWRVIELLAWIFLLFSPFLIGMFMW